VSPLRFNPFDWVSWYSLGYRTIMKIAHRYNWHYAPTHGPFEDGSTQKWCQWCGLRQTTPRITLPGAAKQKP
jgi:hypothetical protein